MLEVGLLRGTGGERRDLKYTTAHLKQVWLCTGCECVQAFALKSVCSCVHNASGGLSRWALLQPGGLECLQLPTRFHLS